MSFSLPPIVKLAERLLVDIEQAVRRFARFHKYSFGADLRAQAMKVARLAHRAWRDRARQAEWVGQLVWAVDDLKLSMQLGSRAADLGRQTGGWHRQLHPNVQNGPHRIAGQRDQILSSRATPAGVKP